MLTRGAGGRRARSGLVRPRRVESALGAIAVVVFAGLVAVQPLACTGPLCPEGWEEENTEGDCRPPPGYEQAVAQRIGTGIYGYALGCYRVPDGDDACTCEVDSLAVGASFTLFELDESPEVVRELEVDVSSDGTFEAELRPGLRYLLNTHKGPGAQPPVVSELSLEEGELLFLVVTIAISC